ncbi:hypothetical protein PMG71_04775 [Roseofilum sp. BLCC_M154]|uniref:Uncharacterized protein n=1 Tax=Roseofilum acuticapitatum BLCC-M154 TaxID=3022444 RepID=A0ABT7APB0_9CYAN|nr:hypothetical protein [Roseofilum acuticapitatum]MDJ1168732.1 hypothetical protein [Roseofilum acuticapitatum BLCC-M154]
MNPSLLAELAIDFTKLPIAAVSHYTAVQYFLSCPHYSSEKSASW